MRSNSKTLIVLLAVFVITAGGTSGYFAYLHSRSSSPTTTSEGSALLESGSGEDSVVTNSEGSSSTPVTNRKSSSGSSSTTIKSDDSPSSSNPSSNDQPADESPSAIVAFYADNQSDTDAEDTYHQRVVNYILATSANPVFHAGDLMEDGTQNSLDRFNAVTSVMRTSRTFYAALGNNDRKVGDASTPSPLYLENFAFPNNEQWYSVNVGNLHMVILDSAFSSASATQLSWLQADLQSAASQSRITGVMFHHPDFASSISSYLINNGVDFVVSGHTHTYAHSVSGGIDYFVTSGQTAIGYLLAKIYQDKTVVSAYSENNILIETVTFNER